jgi:hypothetical protein
VGKFEQAFPDLIIDWPKYHMMSFSSKWAAMHDAVDFAKETAEQEKRICVVSGGPDHPASRAHVALLRSVGVHTLVSGYCQTTVHGELWSNVVNTAQGIEFDRIVASDYLKQCNLAPYTRSDVLYPEDYEAFSRLYIERMSHRGSRYYIPGVS